MATIAFFSVVGALAICYIVSIVRVKRGMMVITANTFDKVLILLAPVAFFVSWCIGLEKALGPQLIVLLVVSGMVLLESIAFAIHANQGQIFWGPRN